MTARVLHVVESLDTGAIESWLIRMLRFGRDTRAPLNWTFYCVLPSPGRLDELARQLGATVLHSPCEIGSAVQFVRALRRTLREGQYEVLHCHHDVVSAVYLAASAGLPIRRVVHIHNAALALPTPSRIKSAMLREPMRRLCLRYADQIVGISNHTLETFLATRPRRPGRDVVLYCGIDAAAFAGKSAKRESYRRELGAAPAAPVLLFVGRMVPYKNPQLLVEILAELGGEQPEALAVFVGSGPLEDDVRRRAATLGVGERVRFLGWRDDIASLMHAADVLVFAPIEAAADDAAMEGLGLVAVEAQAAALPCVLSRGVPSDAIVMPELCSIHSLAEGPAAWASAVRQMVSRPRLAAEVASARIEDSPFSLRRSFAGLQTLHADVRSNSSRESQ